MPDLNSVLFICSGNVFRSAFAEHYFRKKCTDKSYVAFSRGTNLFYAQPHLMVAEIASEYDVRITDHKPCAIEKDDVLSATSIFVMDTSQHNLLIELVPECESKLYYLGSFSSQEDNVIADVSYDDVKDKPQLIRDKFNIIALAINNLLKENISNEN